ncbi:unnamed protein product [Cuscuta europaea]|uniref:SWIM-type domain-containing protein n=1 Tax=Cuscuta europaea TaxID=41803 RepID=A0A9P0YLH2_CUSEU|nr:unnamed protein product [Cuscuta europaea]
MYENYKKVFRGGEYKKKLWLAASTGSLRSWQRHMEAIKNFDEAAHTWLLQYDPRTWSRAHFSTHTQSDALQNNICEYFNSYILRARDLPILSMFEWIRKRLIKRFHVKYTGMLKYKGAICSNKQDLLEKYKYESRNCFCTPADDKLYEVEYFDRSYVVNLNERSYTCRVWDLNGIPCKHGVSAIYANREKLEEYVSPYYSKDTYLAVYNHMIHPVPSKEEWETTIYPNIKAPIPRKPAGRPQKKRIRALEETRNPYKVSRSGKQVVCGNCKHVGHNVRGCKTSLTGETP